MLYLFSFVYTVDFGKVERIVEIPNFPKFKVELLKLPLNPGESLQINIVSFDRFKTKPEFSPSLSFYFEGLKYYREPLRNIPSQPVKVVYGFSRGKKYAYVSLINLVKEGESYYEYRRLVVDISKVPKRGREVFLVPPSSPSLDMVIITHPSLREPFETLAVFRTLRGIRTKVFTLDDIYPYFPGRTYEEKIRNFIKFAYSNWGIRFVLIGGSKDLVPAPRIEMASFDPYNYGTDMESDAYYSMLDGDWNYNGNYLIGEISDTVDVSPDVAVGRIPMNDPSRILEVVRRIIRYETTYPYSHPPKIFLHASKFVADNDACGYLSMMRGFVPTPLIRSELCEMDFPRRDISLNEFVDSVNNTTIFWGFSHSNYRTFIVNLDSATVQFGIHDIFRLNTDSSPLVWLHIGCLVNSPNTNSVGNLIFKEGKSIVSYGPQKESAPSVGINLVGNGFRGAYDDTSGFYAGLIDFYAKSYSAWLGYIETYVYEGISYGLIGDPALLIHKTQPLIMSPSLSLSGDTLRISSLPPSSLVVVVQDGVEIFRDSASGSLEVKLNLISENPILVGINSHNYLPKIETLLVSPPKLSLRGLNISSYLSGENTVISGYLKNVSSITLNSPFVKLLGISGLGSDSLNLPDISPGDSVFFSLNVQIERFVGNRDVSGILIFGCSLCDTSSRFISFTAKGPKLRFVGAFVDTPAGNIKLKILVYNEGGGISDTIRADLFSGPFTLISPGSYPNLQPLRFSDTSFSVILSGSYSPGSNLTLRIYNGYGDTIFADITLPSSSFSPPNVFLEPGYMNIKVFWDSTAQSYLVWRDGEILDVVPSNWRFIRDQVSDNSTKCYSVSRIFDGVIGQRSVEVCGKANPPFRFNPKDVIYPINRTFPIAGQLDKTSPEYEIVFSSLFNQVWALRHNGEVLWVYNVDNYPNRTEISASPAIGDINGDGEMEVVFGVAGSNPGILALSKDGNLLWRYNLSNPPTGPVVLGLFTGGGIPRIAFRSGPQIYFLDGNGNLINSCGPYQWRDDFMAAYDFDGDRIWELVFLSNDTVHMINYNCSEKPGFPRKLNRVLYKGVRLDDINGDSIPEIIVDGGNVAVILDRFGNRVDTVTFSNISNIDVPITLDWNGDGVLDLALMGSTFFEVRDLNENQLYIISSEPPAGSRFMLTGDINGDGKDEAIFSDARSKIHALGINGEALGFPINLGHGDRYREEVVHGGFLIYDVDGDGRMEMFAGTGGNKFYAWNLGNTGRIRWGMVRGNRWNTGYPSWEMPDTNISTSISYKESDKTEIYISRGGRILFSFPKAVNIEIYDIAGKRVFQREVKGEGEIRLNLRKGVYFLKVGKKIYKFII
jgi:outer membrane protein assembly factor BamB